MRKFLLPAVIRRRRTERASIAQLFSALPGGTPGLCYRYADSRFNASQRNGSTGFGASSGPLGLVLDQARGALDALGPNLAPGDGAFDSATGWTVGASWSIGSGVASRAVDAVASNLSFAAGVEAEKTYLVSWEQSGQTLAVYLGTVGGVLISNNAATGPLQFVVKATVSGGLVFRANQPITSLDKVSVREIPGTHAWALSDAARPSLGGFAGGSTLSAQFNGTNSATQTVATLDMTSTDEVTVIAVVRSLTDEVRVIAELTNVWSSNNGTFLLNRSTGNQNQFGSRGTNGVPVSVGGVTQPDSAVIVGRAKISSPVVGGRRNSASEVTSSSSQGTGNYGNHLLNIGARNAASPSLFYNGHIAALCIVGRQPSSLPVDWLQTMTGLLVPPEAAFS